MARFLARAPLAAAAFWLALALLPRLSWNADPSLLPRIVILAIIAIANGLLPAALDRVAGRAPWRRRVVALVALNVALVVGIAAVSAAVGRGVRVLQRAASPLELGILIVLTAVITSIPVLTEVAVDRRRSRSASGLSIREEARRLLDRRFAVLVIFVLSGAAGLIYEVVWSRELVLVFGNTTQAVSAILTGYFGGLALGSVFGGRLVDRMSRPLRLYGLLELGLVVVVVITPLLFRGIEVVYGSGYSTLEQQPTVLALIRYGLALVALAPATVIMGATLPTLSRHLTRSTADLGTNFGRLYAANTFGAVAGSLIAGLVLIELFGLTGALLIGAAGSATAGVAALILDRRRTPEEPTALGSETARVAPPRASGDSRVTPRIRRIAIVVAFVSGLTSLGYQVLWTRLLASGTGSSTYVFTLILATFLVGLALGAVLVARRLTVVAEPLAWLGAAQLVVAALSLAGMPILAAQIGSGAPLWIRVVLVVLPTTIAVGVTLPMTSNLIGLGEERVGRDAGALLGANTRGAICGTFLIPFLAIPTIGSPRSVVLLGAINAIVGGALLLSAATNRRPSRATASAASVAAICIALAALVVPNAVVADPGATRMARVGSVFASAEDEIASVQAGVAGGKEALWVAGTGMTRLTVDAKLMALLPEFTRPAATRMLVIAFGMGSSFRTGLASGLAVDGVELVPSVPEMFPYFQADAAQVLENPRGHLVIADGRNYVALTKKSDDIVMVDPPPPIESSGTAVLYAREFYQAVAERLTADGVMMQWVSAVGSVDEFRTQLRTFSGVFPNVMLAFGPRTGGVYMLGSAAPLSLDPAAIASVLDRPGVVGDLDDASDAPVSTRDAWLALIPTLRWLDTDAAVRFAGAGPIASDDRPYTEYFILRRAFGAKSPPATTTNLRAAASAGD